MDYLDFIIASNFLKNPQPQNDMAFHRIFPFYGNLYVPKHNTPSFPTITDFEGLELNTDSHNTLETNLYVSALLLS